MKLTILIILITQIILPYCRGQAYPKQNPRKNYIDSIQTVQQIESLIIKADDGFEAFKVNQTLKFSEKNCQKLSDSLKIKPWTKADFDNNGMTDLLVVGNWYKPAIICILDKGNNKYEIKTITRRLSQKCTFPRVTSSDSINAIEYFYESNQEYKPQKLEQKTLVYKFGDFIEENKKPVEHKIEKIEYSTSGCFGTCPVFKLEINADRSATWYAEMYNKINDQEFKGNFKAIVDDKKYNEITALINFIDFEKLDNEYEVDWTDDQTSRLKISYDKGKTKSIRDYGLIGTFGLNRLYQLLFELRESQKWIK